MQVSKTVGALALVAVLAASAAWGGAQGEGTGAAGKVAEISVLAWDRGTTPSTQGTIEKNWWVDYVNEHLAPRGAKVRYVPIPRNQEGEKLSTMLAAGDAPDISFTYNVDLILLYVKSGGLIDFTDLVAKGGAPNLPKYFTQEDMEAGRINGRQYTFPYKNASFGDLTWIRKDWLDKLGLAEPETVDELTAVLKQFKAKDPGGVGDRLIPFLMTRSVNGWDTDVMPAFMDQLPGPEKLVTPRQMWPEAKPTLKYLNGLYHQGLLADMVLDKQEDQEKQRFVRGEVGAYLQMGHRPFHPAYGSLYMKLQENVPTARIVGTSPWRRTRSDKKGVQFSSASYYAYRLFSPLSNKHPEAALAYIDWIGSDGTIPYLLGIDGKDHLMVDGFPRIIDAKQFAERVGWIQPQYPGMRFIFTDNIDKWMRYYSLAFVREQDREQWIREARHVAIDKLEYKDILLNAEKPMRVKYAALINTAWDAALPKIVLAPADQFDKLFDQAVKDYRDNGGDAIAREAVELYNKIYKK